jgi:hypothetical protein
MPDPLKELERRLDEYGYDVVQTQTVIDVSGTSCIDNVVPSSPGVYWIHTTMPAEQMRIAISDVLGKEKRIRKAPPRGISPILQVGDGRYYVAYSGTEENICKRLKQHLFNLGHADTVKLGCVIDEEPFSNYRWQVGFKVIDSLIFSLAKQSPTTSPLKRNGTKFALHANSGRALPVPIPTALQRAGTELGTSL